MTNEISPRLERAKEYIAIAESENSKRAAYIRAAEEIAAELQLRTTQREIARVLGKDESFVRAIVKWRKTGYEADTPWLADTEATTRAARSHARTLLSDPNEAAKLTSEIAAAVNTPEVIEALEENEEAVENLLEAMIKISKRTSSKKKKQSRKAKEMTLVLTLIGVLGGIRDLAKDDPGSPLIVECKNLMRETLEVLDGLAEADDPDEVERMLSDFGDFLASQQ